MIDAAGLRVMKAIADEGASPLPPLRWATQPAISQMVRRLGSAPGRCSSSGSAATCASPRPARCSPGTRPPVLAALDAAEEEVAAIAGLRSGRVRLMAFPSASATLVPRALALVK